jgi:hypothetical protein
LDEGSDMRLEVGNVVWEDEDSCIVHCLFSQ